MIKLKKGNFTRKILGIFLSVIIIALSVTPAGLAAVAYPQGVTPEQAQTAMKQTDNVLKALAEAAEGRPLSNVVLSMLFSDATLSSLAKMMYSLGEENSETIQEDYETIMKIMNRARKMVLLEEDSQQATKFKMDRNGNLEKVAE